MNSINLTGFANPSFKNIQTNNKQTNTNINSLNLKQLNKDTVSFGDNYSRFNHIINNQPYKYTEAWRLIIQAPKENVSKFLEAVQKRMPNVPKNDGVEKGRLELFEKKLIERLK